MKFGPEYQRERGRIRKARRQLAYDIRWRKGEDKVRTANRRSRVENIEGVLTLADWQAVLNDQRDKCAIEGCNQLATELDHRIALFLGGTNHPANIQALCSKHHKDKTRDERSLWKRRAKGLR